MTTEEFLRAIWPATGTFVIASYKPRGVGMNHALFTDIAKAAAYADGLSHRGKDAFHAIHTFPAQIDESEFRRTGDRAVAARCFAIDLDVGVSEPDKPKYPDKGAAKRALASFLVAVGWPVPMLVSSGNGVHAYWLLSHAMSSADWRIIAELMKKVFKEFGLLADPAVTADTARVLRPVGTLNFKDPANPKAVELIAQASPILTSAFLDLVRKTRARLPDDEVKQFTPDDAEAPKPSEVAKVCGNFQTLLREAPRHTEPMWYATIQLAYYAKDGVALAHKISAAHPGYDREATDAKLERFKSAASGPTTCGRLDSILGPRSVCASCPQRGLPKSSPIVFARRLPTVELPVDLPPPGDPYSITKRGIEFRPFVSPGDPPLPAQVISNYVVVPSSIVDSPETGGKVTTWTAHVPHRGEVPIVIPATDLGDENKLIARFYNNSLFIDKPQAKKMLAYMSHYIRKLQELRPEQEQFRNMGWTKDFDKFILPGNAITAKGLVPVRLSPTIANAAASITKGGTREGQIKGLSFYDNPAYVRQQFLICITLAAPLLFKLRYYGLLVNAYGVSGASKSTAMLGGGGLYGNPERYVLNGTDTGFTTKARLARMETLASLAVMFDDTTDVPADDIKSMMMSLTQASGRGRLEQSGAEKVMPDNLKSTLMVTSSNNSMHALLSQNNIAGDAGSYRLIELEMLRQSIHTMMQADVYKELMLENYGHLGPEYIQHVMTHWPQVTQAMEVIRTRLTNEGALRQPERFWGAGFTLGLLGCSMGQRLGFFNYDAEYMTKWILEDQLPMMRGIIVDSYASPLGVLQNYLAHIANNMVVVTPVHNSALVHPDREPRGELLARYEPNHNSLYVLASHFKSYCDRQKVSMTSVVRQLTHDGVLEAQKIDIARQLQNYAVGQHRVYRIKTDHPIMTGVKIAPDADGKVVVAFPGRVAGGKIT